MYLSVQSMKLNNFMYRFYFFKYSLPADIFNQLISASLHTRKSHGIRKREKGVKERQSVVSVLCFPVKFSFELAEEIQLLLGFAQPSSSLRYSSTTLKPALIS